MANILIIRFSAFGDVAMTIPVIYSFATQHPMHSITVLSRKAYAPLFAGMPGNVEFLGVDLEEDYKGIKGLNRLFRELKQKKFFYVADFHDVLRSRYLRFRFLLSGSTVAHINKGRGGKRRLTRRRWKICVRQRSSFDRYARVFESLGFKLTLNFNSIYGKSKGNPELFSGITGGKENFKWIGIAPFAQYPGKIYPSGKMDQLIYLLSKDKEVKIFLFGGGEKERRLAELWAEIYPRVVSVIGKLDMDGELALMSRLDVMLSMDSANMHLASLVGTPVVSVWGETHPYAGFMGWNQPEENAVQIDLPCRPCSVFGNKPCRRKDYACMQLIKPEVIVEKIYEVMNK